MDTLSSKFYTSINRFQGCTNQTFVNEFNLDIKNFTNTPSDQNITNYPSEESPLSGSSSDGESSPSDEIESSPSDEIESNPMLKFISEILMEEDLENKTCMLHDCLALQAAEKSFYDVLGQEYPPTSNLEYSCAVENDQNSISTMGANSLAKSNWTSSRDIISHLDVETPLVDAIINGGFAPTFSQTGSDVQPWRNSMETRQFASQRGQSGLERNGESSSFVESSGKKNRSRDDWQSDGDERFSKQSAVYKDDDPEQVELYDKVLLCKVEDSSSTELDQTCRKEQQNGKLKGSSGQTSRGKKGGSKNELVDLGTLLSQCAQAVASSDHRTAKELLKQIRHHSSPSGDGSQRLAHYFADGLEARLAGAGMPFYSHLMSIKVSVVDILKAYSISIQSCPFRKMSNRYANRTILKQAEKATRIHIIDFGIAYGFQWPCLIQHISKRAGGPPSVRITGIEFPQPGFRPTERVEETGRRLENIAKRFDVPFEYNAIAKKWETISLDDFKISRDELTVVNCLYRMKNLPDETAILDSPRDAVLKMIRRIKPDLFIHGIVNGTYNAPFFLTRFREALFHFSALFDMIDATTPRDLDERVLFEKEIYARDAINAISCEGLARVERPETYKQWQARNQRAGFRQLALDQKLLKKVKAQTKLEYHNDFLIDQGGQWMLQGWKGRIFYALSCWKPA